MVKELRAEVVVCDGMQKVKAGIDDLNGNYSVTQ